MLMVETHDLHAFHGVTEVRAWSAGLIEQATAVMANIPHTKPVQEHGADAGLFDQPRHEFIAVLRWLVLGPLEGARMRLWSHREHRPYALHFVRVDAHALNRQYDVIWGDESEVRSFGDRSERGIKER